MSLRNALNGGPWAPRKWGPSKTRQSEMKFSDINLIMAKYEKSGVLPAVGVEGFYADVSSVGDFREAVSRVQRGDEIFMSLSAKVRKEFDNDASIFLDACTDPAKQAGTMSKLHELGVVVPERFVPADVVVPDPVSIPVVTEPVADPS